MKYIAYHTRSSKHLEEIISYLKEIGFPNDSFKLSEYYESDNWVFVKSNLDVTTRYISDRVDWQQFHHKQLLDNIESINCNNESSGRKALKKFKTLTRELINNNK